MNKNTKKDNTSELMKAVVAELKKEEGFSPAAYFDTTGNLTVGFGSKLPKGKYEEGQKPFTREKLYTMFNTDVRKAVVNARNLHDNFDDLPLNLQVGLVSQNYQLGKTGAQGFTKMNTAIAQGDYSGAAREALDSKWATQTPVRAQKLADGLLRHSAGSQQQMAQNKVAKDYQSKQDAIDPQAMNAVNRMATGANTSLSPFERAFAIARKTQGAEGVFEFGGKKYNTNFAEQTQNHNEGTPNVQPRGPAIPFAFGNNSSGMKTNQTQPFLFEESKQSAITINPGEGSALSWASMLPSLRESLVKGYNEGTAYVDPWADLDPNNTTEDAITVDLLGSDERWTNTLGGANFTKGVFSGAEGLAELPASLYSGVRRGVDYLKGVESPEGGYGYEVNLTPEFADENVEEAQATAMEILMDKGVSEEQAQEKLAHLFGWSQTFGSAVDPTLLIPGGAAVKAIRSTELASDIVGNLRNLKNFDADFVGVGRKVNSSDAMGAAPNTPRGARPPKPLEVEISTDSGNSWTTQKVMSTPDELAEMFGLVGDEAAKFKKKLTRKLEKGIPLDIGDGEKIHLRRTDTPGAGKPIVATDGRRTTEGNIQMREIGENSDDTWWVADGVALSDLTNSPTRYSLGSWIPKSDNVAMSSKNTMPHPTDPDLVFVPLKNVQAKNLGLDKSANSTKIVYDKDDGVFYETRNANAKIPQTKEAIAASKSKKATERRIENKGFDTSVLPRLDKHDNTLGHVNNYLSEITKYKNTLDKSMPKAQKDKALKTLNDLIKLGETKLAKIKQKNK